MLMVVVMALVIGQMNLSVVVCGLWGWCNGSTGTNLLKMACFVGTLSLQCKYEGRDEGDVDAGEGDEGGAA